MRRSEGQTNPAPNIPTNTTQPTLYLPYREEIDFPHRCNQPSYPIATLDPFPISPGAPASTSHQVQRIQPTLDRGLCSVSHIYQPD